MQLGDFELTTVSGGRFSLDGGTMFGVVPKAIWKEVVEVNDRNQIPQATNCLLVRTMTALVLIDTGYGSQLSKRQRSQLSAESGAPLLQSLASQGVSAAEVDLVVLTHLHFDHAGGCLTRRENGEMKSVFPNAEYVVQRGEWELAMSDLPELRNAYPKENFASLADLGQLTLLEGEAEISPGLSAVATPGHTQYHQSIRLESQGQVALYLGDLCPTSCHLHSHWCMAYDTHMLETRRQKAAILGSLADNGGLALFDHDPHYAAARIRRDERRQFVAEELVELC